MDFVFVLQRAEPYEGADLLGIYSSQEKAEQALEHACECEEKEWKGGAKYLRARLDIFRVMVDDSPIC